MSIVPKAKCLTSSTFAGFLRYIHNDSDDSPCPIFRASIQCSTIPKFIHMLLVTRFHQPLRHSNNSSPNSISSPDIHSSFISEKTNTQTAASMSSDSSSASSETNTIEVPSFYHEQWAPEYPDFACFRYDGTTYQIRLRQHRQKVYFAKGLNQLPNCAITHLSACDQHMTILRRFGPPLQWNLVAIDIGIGHKYVVQPWYQFHADSDFSHGDEFNQLCDPFRFLPIPNPRMATLPTPSPTTTSSSSKTLSTRRKNASSKWQPQCHPHVIFVLEEDDHNATCQNAHNQGRPLSKALQITLHSPTQPRKNKVFCQGGWRNTVGTRHVVDSPVKFRQVDWRHSWHTWQRKHEVALHCRVVVAITVTLWQPRAARPYAQ
ncbi:hypothetical protein JHK86_035273 [Glycine max]|nr:hypothetical protein JHK86_035273 [Glycine max]